MCIALFYLIYKLTHWYTFQAGNAPMVIGIFLIGSIQLFFIGLLGEYIFEYQYAGHSQTIGRGGETT